MWLRVRRYLSKVIRAPATCSVLFLVTCVTSVNRETVTPLCCLWMLLAVLDLTADSAVSEQQPATVMKDDRYLSVINSADSLRNSSTGGMASHFLTETPWISLKICRHLSHFVTETPRISLKISRHLSPFLMETLEVKASSVLQAGTRTIA